MVSNLPGPAAGKEANPGRRRVKPVRRGELLAGDGRQRQLRQRMAHKLRLHAAGAIERLLEGEDDQHFADVFPHQLDAVLLPGPQLRAHEKDHGNAQAMELLGQPEVNFGKVDEHGHAGPPILNRLLELAELAVDARQVAKDLGKAHHRHIFRAHHALQAGRGHPFPAHAEELGRLPGCGKLLFKRLNQQRAVVLAAGFACRDEDGGGHQARAASSRAANIIPASLVWKRHRDGSGQDPAVGQPASQCCIWRARRGRCR